ncbi:MAG: cell wall hydrolase [Vallitaleaceae bacterium]|nr:cell wall hydrolase [Vallitaleaceae bacterium]
MIRQTIGKCLFPLILLFLFAGTVYADETLMPESTTEIVSDSADQEADLMDEETDSDEATASNQETTDEKLDANEAAETEEEIEEIVEELIPAGIRELSPAQENTIRDALDPANMPIDFLINGKFLETDMDGLVINGVTYAPLKSLLDVMNITDYHWDEENYKVVIQSQYGNFELLVNSDLAIINGVETPIVSPVYVIEDRTVVPVRFFVELFGLGVEWDSNYYIVTITHDGYMFNQAYLAQRFYDLEELQNFSKLVMREAGYASYECKHGVASVVMNHVAHPYYENTVNGVIFGGGRSRSFPPAHKANFAETKPNFGSVHAAKKALRGENSVESCIFFNTRPFSGKTIYKVVDGVYFCY